MVQIQRLGEAFVNALDKMPGSSPETVDQGAAAFRILAGEFGKIPGAVYGSAAAAQVERMTRVAVGKADGGPDSSPALETASHFLFLLIKKNLFKYRVPLIAEIEKLLNRKKGIVTVTVETVFPPDAEFLETLKQKLKQKTGARELVINTRIVPELLGGARLRMGNEILDASLVTRLQKMADHLNNAGGFSW
jgi:hypothetical protein